MRKILVAGLVAAAAAAAACGKSTAAPAQGAEVGTYALTSVGGKALPATVTEGGVSTLVVSGTFTFGSGGTVQISTTYRAPPDAAPATSQVTGTYRRQGNSVSVIYSNGGANTGTLDGQAFTMTNEGLAWLYARS